MMIVSCVWWVALNARQAASTSWRYIAGPVATPCTDCGARSSPKFGSLKISQVWTERP